jgi:predicted ATP-grasp superfamily ATP-dependent carboligase
MEQPSSDQPEVGGVAITRRLFIAAIVAVCVLSAAIGSAISLIAQTGPAGPRGERGRRGPRGPQGSVDTGAIEAEIEAVRSEADTSELEEEVLENEERLEELEEALRSAGRSSSELCGEDEFFC